MEGCDAQSNSPFCKHAKQHLSKFCQHDLKLRLVKIEGNAPAGGAKQIRGTQLQLVI